MEKIIVIDSGQAGPKVAVLGGVHGDEKCGVEALKFAQKQLKITRGQVYLIFGNPEAIRENKRQTEQNLNRMFRDDLSMKIKESYEFKRALKIREVLDQVDFCLDLHASTAPSQPLAICEENCLEIVRQLPVKDVFLGIDSYEPGGTDAYMWKQNKVGICVECGFLGDPQSAEIAKEILWRFLVILGCLNDNQKIKNEKIYTQKVWRFAANHKVKKRFCLAEKFADFAEVTKNQLIGRDGDQEVRAPFEASIFFAHDSELVGAEAFLLAKRLDDFQDSGN